MSGYLLIMCVTLGIYRTPEILHLFCISASIRFDFPLSAIFFLHQSSVSISPCAFAGTDPTLSVNSEFTVECGRPLLESSERFDETAFGRLETVAPGGGKSRVGSQKWVIRH